MWTHRYWKGICGLLLLGLPLFAQKNIKRLKTPDEQLQEVKQIDEFYDRFNARLGLNGQLMTDSMQRITHRPALIRALFDSQDPRWKDPAYLKKLNRFLAQVCQAESPQYLNKFDNQIYAIASCGVEYFSSNSLADLLFRRHVEKEMHFWTLRGVSDDFMEQFEQKLDQRKIIPNAHETNFLSFSNELHAGVPLRSYTDSTFRFDALSAFVFAVDSHLIKFKECERVTIFLTGIKGWILKIEDYTRDTGNTGWLISDLVEYKPHEPLDKLLLRNR